MMDLNAFAMEIVRATKRSNDWEEKGGGGKESIM